VVLRAMVSACSGMPYTYSNPGNETSTPMEEGPVKNRKIIHVKLDITKL